MLYAVPGGTGKGDGVSGTISKTGEDPRALPCARHSAKSFMAGEELRGRGLLGGGGTQAEVEFLWGGLAGSQAP